MSHTLTEIWRHPIKSHGREALDAVRLTAGQTLPNDRRWAVAHVASKFDATAPAWQSCSQFVIGAKSPSLQAIEAELDDATGRITLTHPKLQDITFSPDNAEEAESFIAWMAPLANPSRPAPKALVTAPDQGMTDTDFPSVSLINLASHRAVEAQLGREISPLRWRGNFIFDSGTPWEENTWVGKRLRLGEAELEGVEPIQRCRATTASTRTGEVDADTLKALNDGFGHQDCGLYARVRKSGTVRAGDTLKVL